MTGVVFVGRLVGQSPIVTESHLVSDLVGYDRRDFSGAHRALVNETRAGGGREGGVAEHVEVSDAAGGIGDGV